MKRVSITLLVLLSGLAFSHPTRAAHFTVLHQFAANGSEGHPTGFLSRDTDGTLYGTAWAGIGGGNLFAFAGSAFKIVTSNLSEPTSLAINPTGIYVASVGGQSLEAVSRDGQITKVFDFPGTTGIVGDSDRENTFGPLAFDATNAIVGFYRYGWTANDCTPSDSQYPLPCGLLFRLTLPANSKASYVTLHAFQGNFQGLVGGLDPDGAVGYFSPGIVFDNGTDQLADLQTYSTSSGQNSTIATFGKSVSPPIPYPSAPATIPTKDAAGNYYGILWKQTKNPKPVGAQLYRISPDGHVTILHNFVPSYGIYSTFSNNSLAVASDGTIYGYVTTQNRFSNKPGFLWKVSPDGSYHVIYHFTGAGDGGGPSGQLLMDPITGSLYGTTYTSTNVLFRFDP